MLLEVSCDRSGLCQLLAKCVLLVHTGGDVLGGVRAIGEDQRCAGECVASFAGKGIVFSANGGKPFLIFLYDLLVVHLRGK